MNGGKTELRERPNDELWLIISRFWVEIPIYEREYEAFEVGRRYASTDYETDLQAMDGDNLMRELIRVQSLSNWLQLGIKNELREAGIIAGQQLGLNADNTYAPRMQELMTQISTGTATK